MIIVKIQGGLGNQMFEYASGYGIAQKTNQRLALDVFGYEHQPGITQRHYQLDVFDIQPTLASKPVILFFTSRRHWWGKIIKRLGIKTPSYVKETTVDFDKTIFNTRGDAYLDGYWQSEKYFKHIQKDIQKLFTPKKPLSEEAQKLISLAHNKNSVAIQVRRGDYVTHAKTAALHGTLTTDYFQRGIEYISTRVQNPIFFLITDDVQWATENIRVPETVTMTIADYEQMVVMKSCKHHIISNSSFGWWGAWLSNHSGKIVVAPKKWFAGMDCNMDDRLPAEWFRI